MLIIKDMQDKKTHSIADGYTISGVAEEIGATGGPHTQAPAGIKHDSEKPDMSLLSNIALTEIAKVMTFGKNKYSAHNWRKGFVWSRVLAAAARHLFAFIGGEDKDPETGLSHLAHCGCCIMFLLEFEKTKPSLDDRHKE